MPLSADSLQGGEKIIHETKLHWIALLNEILYSIAYLLSFLVFVVWMPLSGTWIMWFLTVVWLFLVASGVFNWYSTEVTVTSHRLAFRRGMFRRVSYDIPVERIQDIGMSQRWWQRTVGAGDLLVETSAGSGRTALRNVNDPTALKAMLVDAREARRGSRRVWHTAEPSPSPLPPSVAPTNPDSPMSGASRAEQLEILARLHDQGKLTDDEFAAEKSRVLGAG